MEYITTAPFCIAIACIKYSLVSKAISQYAFGPRTPKSVFPKYMNSRENIRLGFVQTDIFLSTTYKKFMWFQASAKSNYFEAAVTYAAFCRIFNSRI